MKRLLAVLSVGALAALVVPSTAGAQSLNDMPAGGSEICTGWQEQLDTFGPEAAGTPFEAIVDGFQQLHDAACAEGGEEPPDDGGEEEPGPHCALFDELITGAEEEEAPAEFVDGMKQIAEGFGCPTGGGEGETEDTTTTTAPDSETTTTTAAEVAGVTASSDSGGTALPATGGGLIVGGTGLGLIGLAAFARRFFGLA